MSEMEWNCYIFTIVISSNFTSPKTLVKKRLHEKSHWSKNTKHRRGLGLFIHLVPCMGSELQPCSHHIRPILIEGHKTNAIFVKEDRFHQGGDISKSYTNSSKFLLTFWQGILCTTNLTFTFTFFI